MLEPAVRDGLHDLRLQEEVAEAGAVNADVRAFTLGTGSSDCQVAFLAFATGSCRGAIGGGCGLNLLIGVVDQVFLAGRHCRGVVLVNFEVMEGGSREAAACCALAVRSVQEDRGTDR